MTYAVELRHIVKRFPGVIANDHIDLAVEKGEIRALVGENGAGKTTLMNILYGLYRPDEGDLRVWGRPQRFDSPLDAIRAGLGMVHQHFMLFPALSVAENVIYGVEPVRAGGFVDTKAADEQVRRLAAEYGLQVEPRAIVGTLPVGVRQRVEILKTLYRDASILILDEPTAVLTPQERDTLFAILRRLAGQGKTILFITHKLNEVMNISDRATVLRGGRVTATLTTADTSPEEITRCMVGREVALQSFKSGPAPGRPALAVEKLTVANETGRVVVKQVSFEVRAGEIVGIAGAAGNGQTELIEALAGLREAASGRVRLYRRDLTHASIRERREAGLAYIPEDRAATGLALAAGVSDNLIMGYQARPPISKNGLLQFSQIARHSYDLLKRFTIKVSRLAETGAHLSGGNQQKLVVARELSQASRLLIAEQPARGLDVGAIEFIHTHLVEYRDGGGAVLLVSAELSEVMALADRILVMYEGAVVGQVTRDEATEERLGLLMAGAVR